MNRKEILIESHGGKGTLILGEQKIPIDLVDSRFLCTFAGDL
jgi:hypothetical protein